MRKVYLDVINDHRLVILNFSWCAQSHGRTEVDIQSAPANRGIREKMNDFPLFQNIVTGLVSNGYHTLPR